MSYTKNMDFQTRIRNFCIIAHIDHGKSTLADRLLELTGTIEKRKMKEQFLDQMDIERERGITIKMQPVKMLYQPAVSSLKDYQFTLNLIDTPGHVDFNYEVSRSLAAVEGAILLVDATQGVQAQTLANLYLAEREHLAIIPVINKVDLPNARTEEVKKELAELLKILRPDEEILTVSAKTGLGVDKVLEMIVKKVPAPKGHLKSPLRALIFDSHFDPYMGVVAHIRVVDGKIKRGDEIKMMVAGSRAEVFEVGVFRPEPTHLDSLEAGEIGYLATGIKNPDLIKVGDTITLLKNPYEVEPLEGYQEPKPTVFASFYPEAADDFNLLKDALSKLKLNDASLTFEPETSEALGRGFQLGFLGMLHLEIVHERLRREYGLNLIATTPTVAYQVVLKNSDAPKNIDSVSHWPDPTRIEETLEPWVRMEIITHPKFMGDVINLLENRRGEYKHTEYLGPEKLFLFYEVPLAEIIVDFYDNLKSVSEGYASMSYEPVGYRKSDLTKLDILIAGERVEQFSRIVPKEKAQAEGRAMVEKLKEVVPRQLFAVAIQAALGGKVIAREDIPAMRKDVTGYLYGGDYSRKRKLLEKQKKGKKKLKARGRIELAPEVFMQVLRRKSS